MKKVSIAIASIALALGVAACSSGTSSNSSGSSSSANTPSAVDNWKTNYGSDVMQLANDLQVLQSDASSSSATDTAIAIGNDCAQLGVDAKKVLSDPPYPDAQKEATLSAVLTNIVSGSQACVAAVNTGDVALMQQAIQDFQNAADAITSGQSVTGA
jgi:hypothetical protein